jgi:hypothetical protein
MSDHVTAREFERFANRIDNSIAEMARAQSAFFQKQAAINNDVATLKNRYKVISGAVIALLIGTVYGKVTEPSQVQPAINHHQPPTQPTAKAETIDLIIG